MGEPEAERVADSPTGAVRLERLPHVANERLSRLFREGERIHALRPDLQAAFPDVRSWDFWYWLLWHGVDEYPEIRGLLPPVPPTHLIQRVFGDETDPRVFHESGLSDWRRVHLSLVEGGFAFAAGTRILDFGCGCARVLRHFGRYAHACELVGADVDVEAVEWSRQCVDFARFEVLPVRAPSAFPDAHFDAVFALSVFSHFPEELHRLWLAELHRITRPGAVVVVTVHGQRVIDRMLAGFVPSDMPCLEELRSGLVELEDLGFGFYAYQQLRMDDARNQRHFDGWDLQQYGSTFILPKYVFARWSELFHIVSWNQAPDDWQDYVILRRRRDR